MAISSYPSAADAGVLCMILANTAMSISILKEILCSILQVMGIRWDDFSVDSSAECRRSSPSKAYMDEFRNQTPAKTYESIFVCEQDCSICLVEFEPKSEVNHLSCGHVFHTLCLEKWLNYWNTTCPLCRSYLVPREMDEEVEDEEEACDTPLW